MWLEVDQASRGSLTERRYNDGVLSMMGVGVAATPARARVAIGFVDYGFDLAHPTLLGVDGRRSRFRHLWNQNAGSSPDCAWDAAELDDWVGAAIATGSRRALDERYDCHADCYGAAGPGVIAHGTMMASMAAGTAHAGFRSAAAGADLIGVHLALKDHHWKEQDVDGVPTWLSWDAARQPVWQGWRSYDSCPQMVEAVRYVYERGCSLGCDGLVINLSLGAWAGAHDGSSLLERGVGQVIEDAAARFASGHGPRTIVVTGAGNAGADEGHWQGRVAGGRPQTFEWVIQRRDPTQNKLEIWFDGAACDLGVTLALAGREAWTFEPGSTAEFVLGGRRIGIGGVTTSGDRSCVSLLIHPPLLPPGDGELEQFDVILETRRVRPVEVNAWVERDDGAIERSWLAPCHPEGTLCCLATVPGAVVVGGFDGTGSMPTDRPAPLPLASAGPAPWAAGRPAWLPLVAAPAAAIWGARSKSRGFTTTTGTSAAVALVSGALARHLAANGADACLPIPSGHWDARLGFGPLRIDRSAGAGALS